jgi:hypothetical protein
MGKVNPNLIAAIEKTAAKLTNGAAYQWGHMGACNCGNLAQELTQLSKGEIHKYAMERHGDWNDQILDYCPTSGYPMDLMISKMLEFGLSLDDLSHLESLSDPKILRLIPKEKRDILNKNNREHVVIYMKTWANYLREMWIAETKIPEESQIEKKLKFAVLS